MRIPLRSLVASRAFAMTAIGTITLAISLAATVFAVVDGVLFKPLPYPRAAELFQIMGTTGEQAGSASLAARDLEYLRTTGAGIAVTAYGGAPTIRHPDRPDVVLWAAAIEPNFFDVIGQPPLVGGFSREHYLAATDATRIQPALVSYALWRDWLGADSAAIGRTLDLIGQKVLVVGVLPHNFVFPVASGRTRPDVLVPLVYPPEALGDRWMRRYTAIVRVPITMPVAVAQAKLDAALAAHVGEYPPRKTLPGPYRAVAMRPLEQLLGRTERPFFTAAFAGAALLVFLGCVNVAGLLAARGRDRERELALRAALGATRGQLWRLLLIEAALVAVAGALLGLALARPLLAFALTLLPETLLLLKPPIIDGRVVGFSLATAVVTMVAIAALSIHGILPPALARGVVGVQTTTPRVRSWARSFTLAAESAIGLALVVAGSLVFASFAALRNEDPGFQRNGLAVIDVLTPGVNRTAAPIELQSRYANVMTRIAASPGVTAVATAGTPMLENMWGGGLFRPPPGAPMTGIGANDIPIGGAFFDVVQLRVLDGREPTRDEIDGGAAVLVVSEQIARMYWPGQRAVGQQLLGKAPMTVIGVVQDARYGAQNEDLAQGEIYVPAAAYPRATTPVFLFRTSRDAAMVAREVALAINRDVQGVIVRRAESFDAALAKSVRLFGFRSVLFAVTGIAGLVLVAVGIGGLVAMGVARRVREIGIRATLGAERSVISRMIVFDHLRPVIAGSALGLVASWWTTKLLSGFLYGFTPHDPFIWAAASALLLMVAMLSAWVPARRASAVDPAVILRVD
jgi:putative ABC transport system permease protein